MNSNIYNHNNIYRKNHIHLLVFNFIIDCVKQLYKNITIIQKYKTLLLLYKIKEKIIIIKEFSEKITIIKHYYLKKNFRTHKIFFFLSKHIIMVNLTTYELKLIAGKRGIKNYQNMSREKLLITLDESERILKNLSQNGLK